jgi:hypothetical protein
MNKNSTRYDLYISYNSAQLNQVKQVCQYFEDYKLRIWLNNDETFDLNSNIDLEQYNEIIYALESSCVFICFPSVEYKKCLKNRIEYAIAVEHDMKIIALDFDNNIQMANSTQIKISESLLNNPKSKEFKLILDFIKLEVHMSEAFKQLSKQPLVEWFRSFQNIIQKKRNSFN